MDKLEEVMALLPPLPEDVIDQIEPGWLDQLWELYVWAKKGRMVELNGSRPKEWRGDGLHEWSYLWGKLDAMTPQWLSEALAKASDPFSEPDDHGARFAPDAVRLRARALATDEFVDKLLARERASASARAD